MHSLWSVPGEKAVPLAAGKSSNSPIILCRPTVKYRGVQAKCHGWPLRVCRASLFVLDLPITTPTSISVGHTHAQHPIPDPACTDWAECDSILSKNNNTRHMQRVRSITSGWVSNVSLQASAGDRVVKAPVVASVALGGFSHSPHVFSGGLEADQEATRQMPRALVALDHFCVSPVWYSAKRRSVRHGDLPMNASNCEHQDTKVIADKA